MIFSVFIILCIATVCFIRVRRRRRRRLRHRKLPEGPAPATPASTPAPVRPKRSTMKKVVIALVGSNSSQSHRPTPGKSAKQIASMPASAKSNMGPPQPIHVQPSAEPVPSAPAPTPAPTKESKSIQPETNQKPEKLLTLQTTQSLKKSELSNSFSQTARAAKKKKRDKRFPHLIPGTVEFMAAQRGEPKSNEDIKRSGTVDDSKIAHLVNSH